MFETGEGTEAGDWYGGELAFSGGEDGGFVLLCRASDTCAATFWPGVGPYLKCRALPLCPYDAQLGPNGPCAVELPRPRPPSARDLPGRLTAPTDAAVANVVN